MYTFRDKSSVQETLLKYASTDTDSHIFYGEPGDNKKISEEGTGYNGYNYYRILNKRYSNQPDETGVLNRDSGKMFLLSEYLWRGSNGDPSKKIQYNTAESKNTEANAAGITQPQYATDYQGSYAQGWCYTFSNEMFSSKEQKSMAAVEVPDSADVTFDRSRDGTITNTNPAFRTVGRNNNLVNNDEEDGYSDTVFFISTKEFKDYFKSVVNSGIINDLFGRRDAEAKASFKDGSSSYEYMFRSQFYNKSVVAGTSMTGYDYQADSQGILNSGSIHILPNQGGYYDARPAFNLDMTKVLMFSAAGDAASAVGKEAGVSGLAEVKANDTSREWKVTLKDSENYGITVDSAVNDGGDLTI